MARRGPVDPRPVGMWTTLSNLWQLWSAGAPRRAVVAEDSRCNSLATRDRYLYFTIRYLHVNSIDIYKILFILIYTLVRKTLLPGRKTFSYIRDRESKILNSFLVRYYNIRYSRKSTKLGRVTKRSRLIIFLKIPLLRAPFTLRYILRYSIRFKTI